VILTTKIKEKINFLCGGSDSRMIHAPLKPFQEVTVDFLNELSKELLKDSQARQFPDVVTFAYWCRKSNVLRLKTEYSCQEIRLGLGTAFHISPSNVPINFAFSFAFSLLAGNVNVIKVPSKNFPQIEIVNEILVKLFSNPKFKIIGEMTLIIQYQHDDEVTRFFSANCDARIIWGGDDTITEIRKFPTPIRSIDVAFSDRYSFSVIDASSVLALGMDDLSKLATSFYNDNYLMDQNACSSPHLIVWLETKKSMIKARDRFWEAVYLEVSKRYVSEPISVIDKYTNMCKDSIELDDAFNYQNYGNLIFIIGLQKLTNNVGALRGKFGYFYEYFTGDINTVAHIVDKSFQTITYFGIDKSKLNDFVMKNSLPGVDRIVPIGSALDISVYWDGYDLIRTLSRIIVIK
jgi:F0F1-type ATP synthase membrane subunit a